MEQRISLITLGVADLAKSIAFYENVLGWKRAESPPEVAFFSLNGVVFGLYPHEDLAKDANETFETLSPYHGFSLAYNARSRQEVDDIFAHLAAKDVDIVKAPEEVFWGGYSGYFRDLDGHLWEVAHNPFWTIRDDGSISMEAD